MQMQTAGLKPITVPLRTDIALARSWADLELLCEQIDSAYRQGDLDLASAEELSAFAAAAASTIPPGIPAEALVEKEARCPCCGAKNWWRNGVQAACAICHPAPVAPAIDINSRQAA